VFFLDFSAPAEGMASSARLSQGNEVASKRIKFVKPQSPRVPVSSSRQKFCNGLLYWLLCGKLC